MQLVVLRFSVCAYSVHVCVYICVCVCVLTSVRPHIIM